MSITLDDVQISAIASEVKRAMKQADIDARQLARDLDSQAENKVNGDLVRGIRLPLRVGNQEEQGG